MKQCPACRTTYTDQTLLYCLADGTPLAAVLDEEATLVRPAAAGQMRVEIPSQQPQPVYPLAESETKSGGGFKIVLGVLAVLLLLVLIGGAIGAAFYFNRNNIVANNNDTKPGIQPAGSPTGDGTDKLKDQIANLERRLNEQKNANRPAANVPSATSIPARVNSPGDGFLALRSAPSAQTGVRLQQIPHGSTIIIGLCLGVKRPGNKAGRWCRTSYNGDSGWIYDSFVIY
ncbi:MAG: hypothetical protein ACKVQJ_08045 [Pyrinomonadaceae bacterium]